MVTDGHTLKGFNMSKQTIMCYCELFAGPFDGYKYTDTEMKNKIMLTRSGKYAIYVLTGGRWDSTKQAHFNRLDFVELKNANN